ncbi:hypothetical protein I308_105327 [Cryptococcus tetragattii IND107]|uniref:Uncharacterized protein n=1 Tax=Cryptococcus tetragattii IND107 TaxID=1296105 RepID=A0ABR3BMR1_9TREE
MASPPSLTVSLNINVQHLFSSSCFFISYIQATSLHLLHLDLLIAGRIIYNQIRSCYLRTKSISVLQPGTAKEQSRPPLFCLYNIRNIIHSITEYRIIKGVGIC